MKIWEEGKKQCPARGRGSINTRSGQDKAVCRGKRSCLSPIQSRTPPGPQPPSSGSPSARGPFPSPSPRDTRRRPPRRSHQPRPRGERAAPGHMELWGLRYSEGRASEASFSASTPGRNRAPRGWRPGLNRAPSASEPRPREMWRPGKGSDGALPAGGGSRLLRTPPGPGRAGPGARPAQPMGATGGVRALGDRERRESLESPRSFPGSQILSAGADDARGAFEPARSEPKPPPRPLSLRSRPAPTEARDARRPPRVHSAAGRAGGETQAVRARGLPYRWDP